MIIQLESSRAITLPRMLPDLELVEGGEMLKRQG